mmetsp:Transcript_22425/g.32055  ORF Transcript_22425/g.32055 Transcript_22425/m.32055 type:complete len:87 (-) Transcript_22425:2041-2301(-)
MDGSGQHSFKSSDSSALRENFQMYSTLRERFLRHYLGSTSCLDQLNVIRQEILWYSTNSKLRYQYYDSTLNLSKDDNAWGAASHPD